MTRLQSRLPARLLGLLATVGLAAFAIGTPVVLIAIRALPSFEAFSWSELTSPDDGTVALAIMQWGAWIAWAVMATSLLIEIIAAVRGIRAPRIPGLPQGTAARLVTLAALLFVATPTVLTAQPTPSEAAPFPASLETPTQTASTVQPTVVAPPAQTVTRTEEAHRDAVRYVTRRNDSLWKIAQEHLGDGRRYVELIELNADVLHGRPDFIAAGLTLRLPAEARREQPTNPPAYVVQPGDTLSEIAEESLGDPMRYPEIFRASRATVQPDGERITDPDLIKPGWTLTLPEAASDGAHSPGHPERPRQLATQTRDDPVPATPIPTPGPTARVPQQSETPSAEASAPADDARADQTEVPGWVLPGLTGGGGVLAGSLLLIVRAHRRTQLRYRRPGHVIALPPPDLLPVEKTLHVSGTVTLPKIEGLDARLRTLTGAVEPLPVLDSITLTRDEAILHLAEPAAVPDPWHGAGATWATHLDAELETPDLPAPYPLLVTAGQDDKGNLLLVNLERLGAVSLIGDRARVEAFARHVLAELALNPWSTRVDIDAIGIGAELGTISSRLTHHPHDQDSAVLGDLAVDLADAPGDGEPETFHAIMTAGSTDGLARLQHLVTGPGRSGVLILSVGAQLDGGTVIELTNPGRLRIPALGLDLLAGGLTEQEAMVCGAIVDLTRAGDNAPVPVASQSDSAEGLELLVDAAGALRAEATEPRPEGAAGDASLLPLASADYEVDAGATIEDVEALAPITPPTTRQRVAEADPGLDEDLASWHDPDVHLPKLTLLGPVAGRAYGDFTVVSSRKPFYLELLAYLALHPRGVSVGDVSDAFSLTRERAYVDCGIVRKWLGKDPRTGKPHLPALKGNRWGGEARESTYRLTGVLSDYDLFRRLRARGQATGAEGIADLTQALELVGGQPFTGLRDEGWSWLLEGERLDLVITAAIVDVAHIVKTHALASDDLDLARTVVETSYTAAPFDEVARLDLIQVARVTGHADLAEQHLVDGIFNRSDDDHGPIDLPKRTARLVKQGGMDARQSRSKH